MLYQSHMDKRKSIYISKITILVHIYQVFIVCIIEVKIVL